MIVLQAFEPAGPEGRALPEAECRQLLATRTLGRIGLTAGALPMIMPVEYVYDDGVIMFRTEADAKLHAAVHGAVLAFEVDAYDAATGSGWTVHVLGRATVLAAGDDFAGLPTLDERGGEQPARYCVRLHCEIVSGRRLASSRG